MCILFYGSLSNLGLYISDRLLNNSKEIIGISSALTDKEQDTEFTNEMFLGRNANFHFVDHVEDLSSSLLNKVNSCIFLEGYFNQPSFFQSHPAKKIKETMTYVQDHCSNLERALYISSTEIYGVTSGKVTEETAMSPKSEKGRYFHDIETLFKQLFPVEKGHGCILRLPLLYGKEQFDNLIKQRISHGDPFVIYQDVIHYKDAIEGVLKVLQLKDDHGFHYFQLSSGVENAFLKLNIIETNENFSRNEPVIYLNRKAKEILGFHPNETFNSYFR